MLFAAVAVSTLSLGIGLPVVPLFAGQLGASSAAIGTVVAVRWVSRLILNIPAGAAVERYGPGRVMTLGAVLVALAAAGSAVAPSWQVLLAARFCEGAGAGLVLTAAMVHIGRHSRPENRGRYFGHFQIAQRIGYWLGPVVGGIVAGATSYRVALWVVTAVAAAAVPLCLALIRGDSVRRAVTPHAVKITAGIWPLLRQPQFLALGAVSFVVFFSMTGAQFTALPLYVEFVLRLGPEAIGWALFAANSVGFALIYPTAWASDHLSRVWTVVFLLLVLCVGLMLLPAAGSLMGVIGASALLGAGTALRGPATQAYLVDLAAGTRLGLATGVFRTMADLGSAVGPFVAGWLMAVGTATFFASNAALALIAAIGLLLQASRSSRNAKRG